MKLIEDYHHPENNNLLIIIYKKKTIALMCQMNIFENLIFMKIYKFTANIFYFYCLLKWSF